MRRFTEAMDLLQTHNIRTEKTDYGFRIRLTDTPERHWADCGMDNDSSISMSVSVNEVPPTLWFFRVDFLEMAHLLVSAFAKAGGASANRADLADALRKHNAEYDDTELNRMTDVFLAGIEDD